MPGSDTGISLTEPSEGSRNEKPAGLSRRALIAQFFHV
jgi:hypothetical protein